MPFVNLFQDYRRQRAKHDERDYGRQEYEFPPNDESKWHVSNTPGAASEFRFRRSTSRPAPVGTVIFFDSHA